MTHLHSAADDSVSRALSDEVRKQAGKDSPLLDYSLLAESAVDALLDYEEDAADEYVREHPGCLDEQVDLSPQELAKQIRALRCPYTGTEGIAYREARERAARLVEQA